MSPHVVTADTRVFVGEPALVPDGLKPALATLFARFASIENARLGWKVTPDSGDACYLLVVVVASDARDAVTPELGAALSPFVTEHPVDVMYAAPGEDHLLSGVAPFYSRV